MFDEMRKEGVAVNLITKNNMLEATFRLGKWRDRLRMIHEMLSSDANMHSYNIALEGLCTNNQVDEALSLFLFIEEKEKFTNIIEQTNLLDGLGKIGKLEITKTLFNKVFEKGLQPNTRPYTDMLLSKRFDKGSNTTIHLDVGKGVLAKKCDL